MIVLASKSPRRREILGRFFEEFEVVPSNADESSELPPREHVVEVARRKAWEVYRKTGGVVIGADTVVVLEGRILGKPGDADEAREMLRSLSARVHRVITGYCIVKDGKEVKGAVETEVEFYELSDEDIEWYVSTGEPMDKAGAYGIQGKGGLFVKGIRGDYYNVVGLPIEVIRKVREML
ncbi:Maf family nucleotide pyrophosphatase [Palaeococcus ferrophilus]|uniref:Maf family nucleotide pyrophosphatase n=1 Tax=Palaeococcus ferrophilus TaxID=83868 RepID=UPI00064FD75E|nr:Maf family nucleotide pyrophosphatase [Palaeococcus ferrophilus]